MAQERICWIDRSNMLHIHICYDMAHMVGMIGKKKVSYLNDYLKQTKGRLSCQPGLVRPFCSF